MATFGTTSSAGTSTGGGANYIIATKYSLSVNGTVSSISVYTPSSGNVKVGIYSDNSGAPNALQIANNTGTAATGGQWNTISVASTLLTAGTYWIAVMTDSASMRASIAGGTNQAAYNNMGSFADCPATFPSPSYQNNDYVAYATYSLIVPSTIYLKGRSRNRAIFTGVSLG